MAEELRKRQPATKGVTINTQVNSGSRVKSTKHEGNAPFRAALFLVGYYCVMMILRFQHRGLYCFYDTVWLCNFNILLAAAGMVWKKPAILGACVTAVFIVHVLWIVDVIVWWSTGSFPVGLAAYVSWPETTWGEIITSTHHVWYSPLCIYIMSKLKGRLTLKSWLISIALITPILSLSIFIPEAIVLENGEPYYLNINLVHGWWKDVNNWPFSLIPKENPAYTIFLNMFVFTQFTITYLVLKIVSKFAKMM